jgi:alpha-glucoside transport system substrate-binding protein
MGGGGHFFTITNDSPAARGFIKWLTTPIASELWMAQGGFLTANKYANNDVYKDKAMAAMNALMGEADPWRYNVGETMPAAVGGGALNKAMVDYVNGEDAATLLRGVQEVWDKNK